ncbi:LemA family protein [Candidatus Woesearchaeota archaeon]|nr:LemA family protein [Candidatus Woesearchaeota archaeon]
MNYLAFGIGGLVGVGLIGYVWRTYNDLIIKRINAERQASHVEVHLKKKFDMIPAIVEAVKGYAGHEKGTFEEVTKLRSQWGKSTSVNEKVKTANMLESAMSKLLIIQERYPKLKADRSFMNLQHNISKVERELVHERKVYNKRVSWYNGSLQLFPKNIIAKLFKFEEKQFFSMKDE